MKYRATQALIGLLLLAAGVACFEWRAGVAAFGVMLWVDSWRPAR